MSEPESASGKIKGLPVSHLLLMLALTLALYLPFIGKPFHLDDPVTWYLARQMIINPLNPPAAEYGQHLAVWNLTDINNRSAFHATPHPPLVPLYLAPFVAISGDLPWVLHLAMFPFVFACVVLMYLIAAVMVPGKELWCAALFAVSPALLVNSQQIMMDIPLGAAMMASIYFMLRSSGNADAVLAGLFAGLACLIKLPGVTIIAVAFAAYLPSRQWKKMALFFLPFCLLNGAWVIHNLVVWGKIQALAAGHANYVPGDIRYRFERQISYQGFYGVFPLLLILAALKERAARTLLIIGLVLSGCWSVALVMVLKYTFAEALLYTACSACGFTIMAGLLTRSLHDRTNRHVMIVTIHLFSQLGIGLFLTLYATRYMIPFVFTAIIYWAYLLRPRKHQLVWWSTALTVTFLASCGLAVCEYQIASAEKKIAQDVQPYSQDARPFYRGRLGYLYYMHKQGYIDYSTATQKPDSGDYILNNTFFRDDQNLVMDNLSAEKVREFRYPLFPLATLGKRAGFNGNGRLPFWYIPQHEYTFILYRVIRNRK